MHMLWLAQGILLQGQMPGPPQGRWPWHYSMIGGGWGMLIWVIIIFIILGGIVLLVRYIFPQTGSRSSENSLEILKKRFAKGEIDKEEFEAKRKDL